MMEQTLTALATAITTLAATLGAQQGIKKYREHKYSEQTPEKIVPYGTYYVNALMRKEVKDTVEDAMKLMNEKIDNNHRENSMNFHYIIERLDKLNSKVATNIEKIHNNTVSIARLEGKKK